MAEARPGTRVVARQCSSGGGGGAVVTLCAIVYTPRYFSGAAPYGVAIVGISTPRPSWMSRTSSEAPLGLEHVAAPGDADQQGDGGALP